MKFSPSVTVTMYVVMCKVEKLNLALWKQVSCVAEVGILLKLCLLLLNIYIHQGRVAHRNKFPSCQSELLVGCRDDEAHSALKWDELQPSLFPRQHLLHFQPVIIRKPFEITITSNPDFNNGGEICVMI